MTTFDDAYVDRLTTALHDEVREMVAYKVRDRLESGEALALPADADPRDFVITVEPMQQERPPAAMVPPVTISLTEGLARIEARGRILEHGLYETCYHYEPDGRDPERHAGWLAELWMEDGG